MVQVEGVGRAEADWSSLRTGETYVGRARAENFASPGGLTLGARPYAAPERLPLNRWALAGEWKVEGELAALTRANGRIVYRFHARDLHLVMGPAAKGRTVPFRVLLDGRPPGPAHGGRAELLGEVAQAGQGEPAVQVVQAADVLVRRHPDAEPPASGASDSAWMPRSSASAAARRPPGPG